MASKAPPKKKSAGKGGFFTKDLGPLPVWGWIAVGGVAFYLYRKNSAGASSASASGGASGAPGYYVSAGDLSGLLGSAGAAGAGYGASVSGGGAQAPVQPGTIPTGPMPPVTPTYTPPAPTPPPVPGPVSASGGTPADPYHTGQVVAPGETIVGEAYSPTYGWINETSKGGVYTSGNQPGSNISQLQYGGSYLGYLSSLPAGSRPTEQALHGTFNSAPTILPGGGYVLTNTAGNKYQFGR